MTRNSPPFIHATADVQATEVGENTRVWQYSVILPGARIGSDCNINAHCFIENDVRVGDRVTVKCGVQLWDGLEVGDDVFIGPNVTFSNDKYPVSLQQPEHFERTIIKSNASIGGNSTILCGLTIGEGAMVGAGSLVTRDIPPGELWYGSPATCKGPTPAKES